MKAEISLSFSQLLELALALPEQQRKQLVSALKAPAKAEEPKGLDLSEFSFSKTREQLKDVHINISDAVTEERRSAL